MIIVWWPIAIQERVGSYARLATFAT
jgi:hypothetical protein